jgi:hypothetical protein
MGTVLNEFKIQKALIDLNADINFDWGARLDIWHPYQDNKQGVFFRAKHICSMDRGQIPQAPIWSTKTETQRVPASDLSYGELTDPFTAPELEFLVDGTERKTGFYFVRRTVKDRLLWIGWQATLRKVLAQKIPGVTRDALERKLGVTIDVTKEIEECEVEETRTHLYDAAGRVMHV